MNAGECGAMSTGSFSNVKAGKAPDLGWFRRRQLRTLAAVAAIVLVAEGHRLSATSALDMPWVRYLLLLHGCCRTFAPRHRRWDSWA